MPETHDTPVSPPAPIQQTVNLPLNGSMGLTGMFYKIGNFTAMAIIAGLMVWLLWFVVEQGRIDRLEDRVTFRDAVKSMNDEANRHTGELRGAMDVNTSVMRELIAEIKQARHVGALRPDGAVPRAAPPGP